MIATFGVPLPADFCADLRGSFPDSQVQTSALLSFPSISFRPIARTRFSISASRIVIQSWHIPNDTLTFSKIRDALLNGLEWVPICSPTPAHSSANTGAQQRKP